jgi:pimeloyl-ACP methyl ester carboxylesterase
MASLSQRWNDTRPTKTFVFWFSLAAVVATIIIGFSWGGWVTAGTAQANAKAMADDAVVHRLTSICVAAAHNDPGRQQKLKALQETGEWERPDYVKKAGWATMPGDKDADSQVADQCARVLASKQ